MLMSCDQDGSRKKVSTVLGFLVLRKELVTVVGGYIMFLFDFV